MDEIINEQNNMMPVIAEQKSSVEITKNTKGYGWKIKIYDDDSDKAFNEMVRIEKECQVKYGKGKTDLSEKTDIMKTGE